MNKILHIVTDLSFTGGDHIYLEKLLLDLAARETETINLHVLEIKSHRSGHNLGIYQRLAAAGVQLHSADLYTPGDLTLFAPRLISRMVETFSIDAVHTHTFYADLCTLVSLLGSAEFFKLFNKSFDSSDLEIIRRIVGVSAPDFKTLYSDVMPLNDNTPSELTSSDFRWISTKHMTTLLALCNERQIDERFGAEPEVRVAAHRVNSALQQLVSSYTDVIININQQSLSCWKQSGKTQRYIPVGIIGDRDLSIIDKASYRPHLVPRDECIFLYASRMTKKKNPDELTRGFLRHSRDHPGSRLVMIGEGPLLDECRQIAQGSSAVQFRGHVDRDSLLALLPSVDAFCLFSVEEGLPLSIQEAMASRLPILATPAGGVGELVIDGDNGLLAKDWSSEGIKECLDRFCATSPGQREKFGGASRSRIENSYLFTAGSQKYAELYESIKFNTRRMYND